MNVDRFNEIAADKPSVELPVFRYTGPSKDQPYLGPDDRFIFCPNREIFLKLRQDWALNRDEDEIEFSFEPEDVTLTGTANFKLMDLVAINW